MRSFRGVRRLFVFAFALLLLLGTPQSGSAQGSTNGSLRGVVSDASGAAVPGAALKLTSTSTGAVRAQVSGSSGQYTFSDMMPGVYTLSVKDAGFQEKLFNQVTIILNETRELNISLSPGEVNTVVEVSTDTASVVTLDTSVGTLIDSKQINQLPLNGRDFQNLVLLAPGATRSAGGTGQGSGVSAGGSRPTNNNYLIDGGDANDPRVPSGAAGNTGSAISSVPLDAIAEFSVITSNASAEFGRSSGAVVNVVTKSGSNDFHASAWEYLRNSALNTRNFFDPVGQKSPFKQNQFGFWAGGHVIRDRTFYSVAYEGFRQRSTSPANVLIPTAQFTAALTQPLAHSIFASMYPSVPGGTFNQYDTNTWSTTINRNIANNLDGDTGFVRLDQKISNANQLFATFSIVDSVPSSATNGGNLPTFGVGNTQRATHIVAQDDHIFSAHLLNVARFSYQRTRSAFPTENPTQAELAAGANRGAGPNAAQPYSADVGNPNGIPYLSFNSGRFNTIGISNNYPQNRAPVVFTYQDTVSYQRGRHAIKFGVQISRVWDNTTFSANIRPTISILDAVSAQGTATLSSSQASAALNFSNINALALNSQGQSFYVQPSLRQYRVWEQAYFVQDSYRATDRLTVDVGLRYEIFNPFTEANNLLSNAYVLDANNKPQACTPLPFDSSLSNVAVVNPASYGIGNYCAKYNDFSPRVGFAYDVHGNGKTVIRGGYGYFYDRVFGNVYGNARFNPPYTLPTNITSGNYTGAVAAATVNTTQAYSLTNIDPALRNPVTNHYNLAVSQQIGTATAVTVSYVGASAQHLLTTQRPNFGTSFADVFRPSNQGQAARSQADINAGILRGPFGNMAYRQSNGSSNYNAVLLEVRRRMSSGLNLQSSYGLSHSLDVLSDDVSGSTDSSFPQATLDNLVAPYMATGSSCLAAQGNASSAARLLAAVRCAENNPGLTQAQAQALFLSKYITYAPLSVNYGDSSFDVRQRFAASVLYTLPFGHNHQFLSGLGSVADHLIGGWGIASIFDTQSGVPFIPISGVDANKDGDINDRVIVTGPVPNRKGSLTKNFTGRTPVVNYFPTCANNASCPFASGDGVINPLARMHRGYLRNPGLFNWDFQANKETRIKDRLNVRFTADFFNVLNHANFNNLSNSTASNQFGQATSTRLIGQTNSRQIQFGLHLQF